MNHQTGRSFVVGLAASVLLTGCAGTETLISAPAVRLTSVELDHVSFNKQTFLLSFALSNPNPFPLPVNAVSYRVLFDDERFVGGKTEAGFTVPAGGDGAFLLSVELDILNSATQITSLLRGGVPDRVNYEVQGSLTVDIPFARPIPFSSSGVINIQR